MSNALFACTKCAKRYPFDALSEGDQMCRECRSNYPMLKCNYCRVEFQQEDKQSTSSNCKKCTGNLKAYGKPSACEYCNTIAAFIGNRCQRCVNSEKKWGPPTVCDQCKQKCAFDRSESTMKKVDGKLLCWLCTMTYKRVLAKTMKSGDLLHASASSSSLLRVSSSSNLTKVAVVTANTGTPITTSAKKESTKEHKHHHRKQHHHHHHKKSDHHRSHHHHHHRHHHKHKHDSKEQEGKSGRTDETKESSSKKPKLDDAPSNGLSLSKESNTLDSSTDNLIAVTQLREENDKLKKQLQQKESLILERDKKLTELKAQNFEFEKNMRSKINTLQKQHAESIDSLQSKNRDLQKQVSQLNKMKKGGINSPLLAI